MHIPCNLKMQLKGNIRKVIRFGRFISLFGLFFEHTGIASLDALLHLDIINRLIESKFRRPSAEFCPHCLLDLQQTMLCLRLIFPFCALLLFVGLSKGSNVNNNNRPVSAIRPEDVRNLSGDPVGTHSTEKRPRLRPVPTLTRDTVTSSIITESTVRNPRLRPAPSLRPIRENLHDEFNFRSVQEQRGVDRRKVVRPLLNHVSTMSVCMMFGLLIWRSLASYEMANEFASQPLRLLSTAPVIAILVANVVGLSVNLLSPLNFKNYLKAIVAANVLREWVEAVYNVVMLFFASSSDSDKPMGEYLGRIFMNIWWNILCFTYIKSRWVLHDPTASENRHSNGTDNDNYQ